jgi:hypothetical protein
MPKNYNLTAHILEDKIVLDGIRSINILKTKTGLSGVISGGMAVSSYIPKEDHRETVDLDYNLLWGGISEEYWALMKPLEDFFKEQGYSYTPKKRNFTWDIEIQNKNTSLLIQHQRRSLPNFDKNKYSFEREIANSRRIKKEELFYDVLSPEDLIVRKLVRLFKFSRQHSLEIPKWNSFINLKQHIQDEKKQLLQLKDISDLDILHLRMEYDVYDIMHLGFYSGVNENYLNIVLKDWANSSSVLDKYRSQLESFLK